MEKVHASSRKVSQLHGISEHGSCGPNSWYKGYKVNVASAVVVSQSSHSLPTPQRKTNFCREGESTVAQKRSMRTIRAIEDGHSLLCLRLDPFAVVGIVCKASGMALLDVGVGFGPRC